MPADEKRISFPANGRDCNGLLGRLGAVLCSLLVGDDCHAAGQDDLYIMPTRRLYVCIRAGKSNSVKKAERRKKADLVMQLAFWQKLCQKEISFIKCS